MLVLLGLDLGDELSQVLAAIRDGVDLLSDQELEFVGWSVLGVDELVDTFSTRIRFFALFCLHSVDISITRKLNLGGFEFVRHVVTIIDQLLQILAIGCHPCVLHAGEHVKERMLTEGLWDTSEQDGLRGQATGAPWRPTVGLTDVDGVKGLACDDDDNQSYID
jgi:hypothetical protein